MTLPTIESLRPVPRYRDDDRSRLPKEAQNEQTKLTANYLNAVGANLIAVGFFTPVFAGFYQGRLPPLDITLYALATCATISLVAHGMALWLLRRIKP